MSWHQFTSDAFEKFGELEPRDLVEALRHRFDAEHISRYFRSDRHSYSGAAALNINSGNSILIEFTSLHDEYPQLVHAKNYRLLLILALQNKDSLSDEVIAELTTARHKDNIDRIVLWTCQPPQTSVLHTLKNEAIDIVAISSKDAQSSASISHYRPVAGKDHAYALALNLAADLLVKRLKKMFHLVLSEVAAPIYDSLYAKQKVATDEMMRFEEGQVKTLIQRLLPNVDDRKLAVDVGCGTGRHTFHLAEQFAMVYGFDFSPLMIEQANNKKRARDLRNVIFSVGDLEHEAIRDEQHFVLAQGGRVDLVVASFGLGSFIEDTPAMLRRFHSWLRDGGVLLLSFYNPKTILSELTPNWRDTSLAAHLDVETNTLKVELSAKTVFHIYCKPWSKDVRQEISTSFDILETTTFPTLLALMPNTLLQAGKATGLFRFVDETLAVHPEYEYGHYVTVVARKGPDLTRDARSRVLAVLKSSNYSLIEHPPVISADDVQQHVAMTDGLAVKTLLLRRADDTKKLIAVVLPARERLDLRYLAAALDTRRIYLGTDRDVLATGFPLGGIAPFGFLENSVSRFFVHSAVRATRLEWIYTGSGDNRATARIHRDDFLRLLSGYESLPSLAPS